MKAHNAVYFAAAGISIVTGLLEYFLSNTVTALEKGNPGLQIFLIVVGTLQIFWAVGFVRKWGNSFYSIAAGLTVALFFLWILLRLPFPVVTTYTGASVQQFPGAALPITPLSSIIQALQIVFLALCAMILSSRDSVEREETASKTNITNELTHQRSSSMARRMVVLGIGAAVLIVGLIGVIYTMQKVVQEYEVTKTSVPPYTSQPDIGVTSSVYVEIAFVIILIAGLIIASYGASLPGKVFAKTINR
jgi:Ca2+/Na+ antiporter